MLFRSFSSWKENKDKQDNFEIVQNEKLIKNINRLELASKNAANWSNTVEQSRYKTNDSESMIDRGYVGHKSAKMMKKSKVIEQRIEKAIDEKSSLLKNIDKNEDLKIIPIESRKIPLIVANNLQVKYDDKEIFSKVSFEINNGERIALVRKKWCWKIKHIKIDYW